MQDTKNGKDVKQCNNPQHCVRVSPENLFDSSSITNLRTEVAPILQNIDKDSSLTDLRDAINRIDFNIALQPQCNCDVETGSITLTPGHQPDLDFKLTIYAANSNLTAHQDVADNENFRAGIVRVGNGGTLVEEYSDRSGTRSRTFEAGEDISAGNGDNAGRVRNPAATPTLALHAYVGLTRDGSMAKTSPPKKREHRRIYPEDIRVANLRPIPEKDGDLDNGRLCDPTRIIPGLAQLGDLGKSKTKLLEAETFAHFAKSAGDAEATLVTPVALALENGKVLLLPTALKKDLKVVAVQELAHQDRYGTDVSARMTTKLGYKPAALSIDAAPAGCSTQINLDDVARYVVAEATASGTLFGDHGQLCPYSALVIRNHRADEMIHNTVALQVNIYVVEQSSGRLLKAYVDTIGESILSSAQPNRAWVTELVNRLGFRSVEAEDMVTKIMQDPANKTATIASCAKLLASLEDNLPEDLWLRLATTIHL